ncbi:MAG TPA: adenylate/guanylate cyclase domain-containing protein, partial [Spirochaetota bacterium]|nr:adenylate/guanylate cyclase domain-containing protein [Spirochaetota bacterium]
EALNKPFGTDILISEDSYAIVKDLFVCEPMQKIKVKGKSEPQQIYAVLGRMNDPSAPKSLDELRAMLGIEMKGKPDAAPEEEVKYEIIE